MQFFNYRCRIFLLETKPEMQVIAQSRAFLLTRKMKYAIMYNQDTISEADTYTEALNVATLYGNGTFEDIIIVDIDTAEIITKLKI